jgi:hypothetical protein
MAAGQGLCAALTDAQAVLADDEDEYETLLGF